jgi:hypothetical protein
MKRVILAIAISLIVLVSVIILIFNSGLLPWSDYLQLIIILVVLSFGFYTAYRRFSSSRKGQPAEDELSRIVRMKASSLSFYISIYLWLLIMFLTERMKWEADRMFGWGIIGMALTFVLCWVFFNFRGLRNE